MTVAIFHGSPRRGNTYRAARIFLDELSKRAQVRCLEFFLPDAMPLFCTGCQLCLGNPHERCPHARYVEPILSAIIEADALVFTTPHHGACSMSSGMKNLLDHLDFLTMNVAPRRELFGKKAFILTTAAGSAAAIRPIRKYLLNWGVNRVHSLGIRMFSNAWDAMPQAKQARCERALRRAARRFWRARRGWARPSTVLMYHMSKWILRRYAGRDAYPYRYWEEQGFFRKRPF